MKSLTLIVTGGTLDKVYLPEKGELGFTSSIVPSILKESRVELDINVVTPFMIDSLDMNDHHREQILKLILADACTHILITHGTDTMVDTAKFLQRRLPSDHSGRVLLTGAMVPARLPNSDAHLNLGFALGTLSFLDTGVHIAMNGHVFSPDNCIKNKTLGRFESLPQPE